MTPGLSPQRRLPPLPPADPAPARPAPRPARTSWGGAAFALGLLAAGTALAGDFRWGSVAEAVAAQLEAALAASRAGDADGARQAVLTAYFGLFEDRKMEAAVRKELGQAHTAEVEDRFNALRKAVGGGAAPEALAGRVAELSEILRQDALALDKAGVPEQVYLGR